MRPILSSRARISFSSGAECARAEALDVRVRPEPSGPSERAAQGAGWAYVCSAHSVDALTKTQIGGFRDSRSAKVGAVVRCEDGSSRSRPGTHTLRARRRLGMPTIEIIKPRTSGACLALIRSCRDARPGVRAGSRARGRCWRRIRGCFGSVLITY